MSAPSAREARIVETIAQLGTGLLLPETPKSRCYSIRKAKAPSRLGKGLDL